ncbi:MAG: histidine--tRNA ligase [Candidatus Obscuribacter sp.]|nr:histidine--tRNA ligase [Candidatus Melainabacteria bacterium]MDX1988089.1 histidine--tRNA ligase [Candidatus Obscuribacter sp.]
MAVDSQISSAPQSGMRDFLPREVRLRDWATAIITATYEQFGFTKIETPCLENIALLKRGDGGENLQLIFEVLKRGDKLDRVLGSIKNSENNGGESRHSKSLKEVRQDLSDMGLRFDLTVPLVRFYSHNQQNLPNPFKSIQIGSVWRAESAQQGRFRQFTQCDIDIFGVKSELAEIELLQATSEALVKLGFEGFTICINDRRMLSSLARYCGFEEERFESVFIALDKLDKIGLDGVGHELAGQGHKEEAIANLRSLLVTMAEATGTSEQQLETLAGKIAADSAVSQALKNIMSVVMKNADGRFNVQFEPSLVRGMGYYTGPIFEIKYPGYNYSVAGGGRYDKMVGKMSGRDVPACGFSIGFERIIGILMDEGFEPPAAMERVALIFDENRDQLPDVMTAAANLRARGMAVVVQSKKKDMRKQIDQLPAQGIAKLCLFKGDVENLEIKPL